MSSPTMAKPCTAVRRDDIVPVCPCCEAELPEIYLRKPKGPFGTLAVASPQNFAGGCRLQLHDVDGKA